MRTRLPARPTCQYLEEQRSMQLFSPTLSSPSLYLRWWGGAGVGVGGAADGGSCGAIVMVGRLAVSTYLLSMHFS